MIDQKSKLLPRGLKCEFVGGRSLDRQSAISFYKPRKPLGNPTFRTMFLKKIYKDNLVALVIDEAHCVKTWLVNMSTCVCV